MTGHQLDGIRRKLGLTWVELGVALGYRGANVRGHMMRLAGERKPIPPPVASLARLCSAEPDVAQWLLGSNEDALRVAAAHEEKRREKSRGHAADA